jgi:hypothetical protein
MNKVLEVRKPPVHKKFKIGDVLIFKNEYMNYKKPEGQIWFKELSFEDISQMKAGNEIWTKIIFDQHSKIYGYKLMKIAGVLSVDNMIGIYCKDNKTFLSKDNTQSELVLLTDEDKVFGWTEHKYFARHI